MKIWTNTNTLTGFDSDLLFTESKEDADIALLGSKAIDLIDFSALQAIFRAGIGSDNVPKQQAQARGIVVRYPSQATVDVLYDETARFTCSLVFRMLYKRIGAIEPWEKHQRTQMSKKTLLIIGTGNIGLRVAQLMTPFLKVNTFDTMRDGLSDLDPLIRRADCITLHIPNNKENASFFDREKLSLMKDDAILVNTARGPLVEEEALYDEIQSGRLSAAFDVFWQEPYEGKLKEFHPDTFVMTPHVASNCTEFLQGCRNDLDKLIAELSPTTT